MEYRKFGPEKKLVSRIGFGGAPAGLKSYLSDYDPHNAKDRNGVIDAVRFAYDNGINYFDTAAGYGAGESERIMGEALKDVCNDKLYIATKVFWGSAADVRMSVENSLENLKRDSIDLIQLHGSSYTAMDENTIFTADGTLSVLKEYKAKGYIKSIGFTTEDNNDAIYRFIRSGEFDMMQIAYNFMLQHSYDPTRPFGSLLEAKKHNMGISTMRTTTSGTVQKWINMVNPDNDYDYTADLIQFVLSNPYVDVALIGMRDKDIVQKNIDIERNKSGRIDIKKLHERYV